MDLNWISRYKRKEPNFGLDRITALLQLRKSPHLKVPVIHIAGTNGKGSTIAYLSQLLQSQQLTVGVFTSPYVIDYTEQIKINDTYIPESVLSDYLAMYRQLLDNDTDDVLTGITEFELITAIAFDYFCDSCVDVAIMEVGMGGLLDSTNVCLPVLTGITTIGLDHVALLGHTIEAIARQKAGIIKANVPVVVGRVNEAASQVIEQVAKQRQAPFISLNKEYRVQYINSTENGEVFCYSSHYRQDDTFTISLLGQHQADNAAMAIMLFDYYCSKQQLAIVPANVIQKALSQASWPARMEKMNEAPVIFLDGAHNPHAMDTLVNICRQRFSNDSIHFLFSCLQTKNVHTMVKQLQTVQPASITLTTFDDERAISYEQLVHYQTDSVTIHNNWQHYLDNYVQTNQSMTDILIITGSLYFVSQVRDVLLTNISHLNKGE